MRPSITVCRSGMVSSRLERQICLTNSSSFLTETFYAMPAYNRPGRSLVESPWRYHRDLQGQACGKEVLDVMVGKLCLDNATQYTPQEESLMSQGVMMIGLLVISAVARFGDGCQCPNFDGGDSFGLVRSRE